MIYVLNIVGHLPTWDQTAGTVLRHGASKDCTFMFSPQRMMKYWAAGRADGEASRGKSSGRNLAVPMSGWRLANGKQFIAVGGVTIRDKWRLFVFMAFLLVKKFRNRRSVPPWLQTGCDHAAVCRRFSAPMATPSDAGLSPRLSRGFQNMGFGRWFSGHFQLIFVASRISADPQTVAWPKSLLTHPVQAM